jgi:hypothetical protein
VVYNAESAFIRPETGNAGQADSGTRVAARFRNIPAGVRLFVSTIQTAGSSPNARASVVPGTGFDVSVDFLCCREQSGCRDISDQRRGNGCMGGYGIGSYRE